MIDLSNKTIFHEIPPRDLYSDYIQTINTDGYEPDRIVSIWNEIKPDGVTLRHIYASGLDKQNNVFLDCRKRLIFSKVFFSTLARPIHGIIKICYHLSMIPVAKAIFLGLRDNISGKETLKNIALSFADIIRTPLYEIAMSIVGLAGILIAPFAPTTIYKCREIIGKLETTLFREKFHCFALTPCFTPVTLDHIFAKHTLWNLRTLIHYNDIDYGQHSIKHLYDAKIIRPYREDGGTYYKLKNIKKLNGLQITRLRETLIARSVMHFGRSRIGMQRENYNPFYQIFGKLNPNKRYVSPMYNEIEGNTQVSRVNFLSEVDLIHFDPNKKNSKTLSKKELFFNEENNRLKPNKIRNIRSGRATLISKIREDLLTQPTNTKKKIRKRIRYLAISIGHAYDEARAFSTNAKKAQKHFSFSLDKMLEGQTENSLDITDGDLFPFEIQLCNDLKDSALIHAKKLFQRVHRLSKKSKSKCMASSSNGQG